MFPYLHSYLVRISQRLIIQKLMGYMVLSSITIFSLSAVQAQQASPGTKVVPPPPNAASLGIYGQVPVSLYTGVPNISIPLYTIQYKDITLPISISYHAQGIKVEQEASWVGLGWTLNSGGTITRTTRGYDDIMKDNGHIGYPMLTDAFMSKPGESFPVVDAPGDNTYNQFTNDYEPDIFYYNFAGQSGKFFLNKAEVGPNGKYVIKGTLMSAAKVSITYYSNSSPTVPSPYPGYWEVVTPEGLIYRFETKEYTFVRRNTQGMDRFSGSAGADASCLSQISNGNTSGIGVSSALYDYENKSVNPSYDSKQVGAWHLSRIISPTSTSIQLVYDTITNYASLTPLMRSESNGGSFDIVSGNATNKFTSQMITKDCFLKEIRFGAGKVEFFSEARADVQTLNSANFPYLATLLSLYNITGSAPQRLKQIKVSHPNSTATKTYDFQYSYFNNEKLGTSGAAEFLRLKLEAVVENGIKKHTFTYDQRKALPSKNSFDKDHWGYYNGEWNNYGLTGTQVPMMLYQAFGSTTKTLLNGSYNSDAFSIRRPDEGTIVNTTTGERDFPYMKAGSLTQITYPTGGTTSLEYEPNTYAHKAVGESGSYIQQDDDSWQMKTVVWSNYANGIPDASRKGLYEESPVFEVKANTLAKFTYTASGTRVLFYPNATDLIKIIPVSVPSNPTRIFQRCGDCNPRAEDLPPGQDPTNYNLMCGNSKCGSNGYTVTLLPGTYKIAIKNAYTEPPATPNFQIMNVQFTLTFPDFDNNISRNGGGLRIKRMIDSDGMNPGRDQVKLYTYTTTQYGAERSSGKLMATAIKYCFPVDYDLSNDNIRNVGYCIRSGSTYPLSSAAAGSSIGYSKVTVHHGNAAENGRQEYLFVNEQEQLRPLSQHNRSQYIPDLYQPVYAENGFVYKEVHSEKKGTSFRPLREIERNYEWKNVQSSIGYRYWGRWMAYTFHSRWTYYTDELVRDFSYDALGNAQVMSSLSKTYHDNQAHFLPTRTEQQANDGSTLVTYTRYPADFSDTDAGLTVNAMKGSKHMHSLPVQQTTVRKKGTVENVLSSQITQYSTFGSGFVKPSELYQLKSNRVLNYNSATEFPPYKPGQTNPDQSRFERKTAFLYDSRGNLVQYRNEDNITVTVIWSYDSQYPVAEIKNANYTQVETALGGTTAVTTLSTSASLSAAQLSQLNNLRTQLSSAMVSIYTYDPLLGMTSATDAAGVKNTYEYDGMGRLQAIKDQDGNILKNYQYHYKGE